MTPEKETTISKKIKQRNTPSVIGCVTFRLKFEKDLGDFSFRTGVEFIPSVFLEKKSVRK